MQISINTSKYEVIRETESGILVAPLNRRTGKPLKSGNIIVDKETGNAYELATHKLIGQLA